MTIDFDYAALKAPFKAAQSAAAGPLKVLTFEELNKPNLTTRTLVKGLLDGAAIALVYGESGSGKTFFTLDLALHIATGQEWFGLKVTPGRVVYVAAEAGASIRNRVAAFGMKRCPEADRVDFAAVISPVNLCDLKRGDVERLIEAVGKTDVVVIDTVSRAMAGGNENAPEGMGAFVTAMDQIRERLGCTIIAVHHVGKDRSRGGRGHSSLHCAVDTEIEVVKKETANVATVTKQRDNPGGRQLAFRLDVVELGTDQDGDPVTTCLVEPMPEWSPPTTKATEPTGHAKIALDVLWAIREDGTDEQCRAITLPDGREVLAVKIADWRQDLMMCGKLGGDANFRNAWARARKSLQAERLIEIDDTNTWAWPTVASGEPSVTA